MHRRWEDLFKEGVLEKPLEPSLLNSEKYYKKGRAREAH